MLPEVNRHKKQAHIGLIKLALVVPIPLSMVNVIGYLIPFSGLRPVHVIIQHCGHLGPEWSHPLVQRRVRPHHLSLKYKIEWMNLKCKPRARGVVSPAVGWLIY